MLLIAQATPTHPTSGDFWNPNNWVEFIKAVGFGGFFAIVLFGFFVFFLWKALGRWESHLERAEKLQSTQLSLCTQVHRPGGTANVSELRDAADIAVSVLQDMGNGIGKETGDAIRPKLDRMREKLKPPPQPLPMVDIQSVS